MSTTANNEQKVTIETTVEKLKRVIHGFYGIGAVGWAPNPHIDFRFELKTYLETHVVPEWRTHRSSWGEKIDLKQVIEDYARACVEASLKEAAENAKVTDPYQEARQRGLKANMSIESYIDNNPAKIDKSSITNEKNIKL